MKVTNLYLFVSKVRLSDPNCSPFGRVWNITLEQDIAPLPIPAISTITNDPGTECLPQNAPELCSVSNNLYTSRFVTKIRLGYNRKLGFLGERHRLVMVVKDPCLWMRKTGGGKPVMHPALAFVNPHRINVRIHELPEVAG